MNLADRIKVTEDVIGKTVFKGKTYTNRLSADPKPAEVLPHLHRKATKRLRKKIAKNLDKYGPKYVQPAVLAEYNLRRWAKLGEVIGDHTREVTPRPSLMRWILAPR